MIHLRDSLTLAYTKYRTHKVRTGITVGVAGILFGVIFGGVFIAQGVIESVERFNKEGLADRSLVEVSKYDSYTFDTYEHAEDSDFIAEVWQAHNEKIAMKTAAAKKYGIAYDAKTEDPSPLEIDQDSGKERISESALTSALVLSIAQKRKDEHYKPLDINEFIKPYTSAKILEASSRVQPSSGWLLPMEDGKEKVLKDRYDQFRYYMGGNEDAPIIQVLDESVTTPFIVDSKGSVPDGELPGIVSFKYAEKLLGLKPLGTDSTNEQKLARLQEVRSRIDEITASFCYRNQASQNLVGQATSQKQEIERNKNNKEYAAPSLLYSLPPEDSCGAVTISKDARTEIEKRTAENLVSYQKEIGEYIGDPVQHKVTLRAIGLSGDAMDGMSSGAGDMVKSLLGSWLGYGALWTIPAGMLSDTPPGVRPVEVFGSVTSGNAGVKNDFFSADNYLVEFSDKAEARDAVRRSEWGAGGISATPFGSGVLIVDQFKEWFQTALLWALGIVGGIALIILASLIGRMVSDGRRESAVFRAIGARRTDIASIYGMYAFLLSLRVALFALVLGLILSVGAEMKLSADATTSAKLAYAAVDMDKSFHFIGINSWYIPVMIAVIVLTGLLASIIPILLGARRNPISDMRDDT